MLTRIPLFALIVFLAVARPSQAQEASSNGSASELKDPASVSVEIRTVRGSFAAGRKDFKPWLIFRDPLGKTVWERTFSQYEGGSFVNALALGSKGFLAGGTANEQTGPAWVVRLGPDGATLWEQTFADKSYSILAMTPDWRGGYFLAGGSSTGVASSRWIASLDDQGKILWRRNFDGPENWGVASHIEAVPGGGAVVAGQHWRSCMCEGYRGSEPWVARLNENGETIWEKTLGSALSSEETKARSVDFRLGSVDVQSSASIMLSGRIEKFVKADVSEDLGGWELRLDGAGEVFAKEFSKPASNAAP